MNIDTFTKPGYLVSITTWENDGDNYIDEFFNFSTKEEVDFCVDLVQMFKDGHNNVNCFGNLNDYDEEFIENQLIAHGHNVDGVGINDLIGDWIGFWCDGQYWRVFDSVKVYEITRPLQYNKV